MSYIKEEKENITFAVIFSMTQGECTLCLEQNPREVTKIQCIFLKMYFSPKKNIPVNADKTLEIADT